MQRSTLLASLKAVSAALSSRDFIPVFACYCFADSRVLAYDDLVAMSMPCDLDITGAVRGVPLLNFVTAAKVKEITVEKQKDGEEHKAVFKAGRSKLTGPMIPEDDFVFERPSDDDVETINAPALRLVVQRVLSTMGFDPTRPEMMGVTVVIEKKKLTAYSTNDKMASTASIGLPKKTKSHATIGLSPRFCELFASIKDPAEKIVYTESWIEVTYETGLTLFSRNLTSVDADQYESLFAGLMKDAGGGIKIPKGLGRALERALAVAPADGVTTRITAKDGDLKFNTTSTLGVVNDRLPKAKHDDISVVINPTLVKSGLDQEPTHFALTSQAALLWDESYIFAATTVVDHTDDED